MHETQSFNPRHVNYLHLYTCNMLLRFGSDVIADGETISRITCTVLDSTSINLYFRSKYRIIRVVQSSFLVSFRVLTTHRVASATRVRPKVISSRGRSRICGVMQLSASGMVSMLAEFSISSDTVVVSVCRSCRWSNYDM
jgi:hypothetical protein